MRTTLRAATHAITHRGRCLLCAQAHPVGLEAVLIENEQFVARPRSLQPWRGDVQARLRTDRAAVGGRAEIAPEIDAVDERLALAE